MNLTHEYGQRIAEDAIRFERRLEAPIDRVWASLTTAEGLAPWLGTARIELRKGGDFIVNLTPDILMAGTILILEPPRLLVIAWHELENGSSTQHATTHDDRSELSFALEVEGDGTRLILTHRLIRGAVTMTEYSAGWHAYLDALASALEPGAPVEVGHRYEKLRPYYEDALRGDEAPA